MMTLPLEAGGRVMSQGHAAVLEQILQAEKELYPGMNDAELFELFAAKNVLRDYSIDNDDMESGLVGQSQSTDSSKSGSDGGIDGLYIFVNGSLIRDLDQAEETRNLKRNIQVDVIIIQASTEAGFRLNRVIRLKDTSEDIFSIDREPSDFTEKYSDELLDSIQRFRVVHKRVASKFPKIHVAYFYVTKGDPPADANNPSGVQSKATSLTQRVKEVLPTIDNCTFVTMGAQDLCELATKRPKDTFELICVDTISDRGSYMALVPMAEYYNFITTENHEKREHLFDSNVRGYQGEVDVNNAIYDTLREPKRDEDFWWLNNGITIICSNVGGDHRRLTIEDPQIVNGHQTSHEIFDFFMNNQQLIGKERRNIAVRIIKATDIAVQDAIIRATNSQTAIPPSYLWSTDPIHRQIEWLFRGVGLYYDRRKNYWRRKDIPPSKILGIGELAQSVAAIYLQEPDQARARPARYFKKETYNRIFRNELLELYPLCGLLKKRADAYLRKEEPDKRHRNNVMFYLLTAVVCGALRTPRARSKRLAGLSIDVFTPDHFQEALEVVRKIYAAHGGLDRSAKGPEMANDLKAEMRRLYSKTANATKSLARA